MRILPKRRSGDILSCRIPLGDVGPRDVGGKGWNLLRLYNGGYPVPPFCLVSSRVFKKALRPGRKKIDGLVGSVDFNDRDAVERAVLEIREIILGVEISPAFRRELESALDRLFDDGTVLAVRSSVVGEDSANHSFAGQMDSFLNVAKGEALEAVKKVWTSAFSARALRYRKEKSLSLKGISAAVVIQKMVNSAASGVLFTRNPETREAECVVAAGFGLGDGVVLNRVETDTYRMRWGKKEELTKDVSSTQVLTDDEIRRLCGLGIKAERSFGRPQDIEWAVDAQGAIFVLQARPIVFGPVPAPDETVRVWDNSNIVESYPGLTLPLTFSFVRGCYEIIFSDVARSLDPFRRALAKREDIFPNMIGLLGGRVYYNLLNWYEMLSYLPGFEKFKESWDRMIGISQWVPFPEKNGSPWENATSVLLILGKLLTVRRTIRRFFAHFRKAYATFGERDFSVSSAADLIDVYGALKKEFAGKWYLTLHNDFCAMTYYEGLRRLCARWGFEAHPNLHNNLLCGEKGVESAVPVKSLLRLAEILRGRPLYRRLITNRDNAAVWRDIQKDPALRELKNGFDDYLRRYGDRGTEELKLETPAYREEPARLVGLVRNYYDLSLTVGALEAKEREVRGQAEDIVRSGLRNPLRRLVFGFVLGNARRAIAGRENMRFARTRLFGIVRRLSRRAGVLFADRGLLDAPSDIYYLTLDEVFDTVRGTSAVQNLKALVALRKVEYEAFGRLNPKDRFVTRGIPGLDAFAADMSRKDTKNRLQGIHCSGGVAEGAARIVHDPRSARADGPYILVAESTDPGWVFLMVASRGIVVERGSVLSHTAIIGRELGIPTIVGVKDATRLIPDGASVFMDGSTGEVRWQ
jgi:phosphohistidine swiveling domain-containing protein